MEENNAYRKYMTAQGALLPDTRFSMREIIYRLFFRFRLFAFCAVAVPVLALLMVILTPPTYRATAKILIKYNDSVSPFFENIASSQQQVISGQSSVEIMRSIPLCKRVVRALDLKSSDMARPAYKMALSRLAWPLRIFSRGGAKTEDDKNAELVSLAEGLKDTITPRLIEKGSRDLFAKDELIEVEVRSFNGGKVADITNTLCDEFINEFYMIYENEAAQAHEHLTHLIEVTRQQIAADTTAGGKLTSQEWASTDINANPIVSGIARQVTELENKLFRLQRIYAQDAPEVKHAEAELSDARQRLAEHKLTESAESVLNSLLEQKRNVNRTLQLYRNRLIPISVVERAVPPETSFLTALARYGVALVGGLILGAVAGFVLVMFFSALDRRLYTPWDVERNTGLGVIGSIPESDRIAGRPFSSPADFHGPIDNTIVNMLGMLDLMSADRGRVLLITSQVSHEGKTTVAFQTATALARDKRAKVLLIDANFSNPDLSDGYAALHGMSLENTSPPSRGVADVLLGDLPIEDVIVSSDGRGFDFVPSGADRSRKQAGFYKKSLKKAFSTLRDRYDLVVVDSPGLLMSVDSSIFASEADSVVLVARAGLTRIETVKNAVAILERGGIQPVGVILNFRKFPVPKALYG